ncbi:hypothetical protein [Diplocloster hominis]|uniref:hypothetical protein n=1 Tax=Diplocloster hominis TaxID=3079010 RepID=UPI0031BB0B71
MIKRVCVAALLVLATVFVYGCSSPKPPVIKIGGTTFIPGRMTMRELKDNVELIDSPVCSRVPELGAMQYVNLLPIGKGNISYGTVTLINHTEEKCPIEDCEIYGITIQMESSDRQNTEPEPEPIDITVNDVNLFELDHDETVRLFGKPDLSEDSNLHYRVGDVNYTFCVSGQTGTIRSFTVEKDFSNQMR